MINTHGTILNFQKFSDVILSLVIDMEDIKVNSLHACLSKILSLENNDPQDSLVSGSYILFLNITFSKGTGDMEIEVPNIPK